VEAGGSERALGTVIGPYRIEALLGEGGIGKVFRAVRLGETEPVALKVMCSRLSGEEEPHRRFLREARAAGEVRHKHLVPVLGRDGCSTLGVIVPPKVEHPPNPANPEEGRPLSHAFHPDHEPSRPDRAPPPSDAPRRRRSCGSRDAAIGAERHRPIHTLYRRCSRGPARSSGRS
jgi:serine/threonine protein kinase